MSVTKRIIVGVLAVVAGKLAHDWSYLFHDAIEHGSFTIGPPKNHEIGDRNAFISGVTLIARYFSWVVMAFGIAIVASVGGTYDKFVQKGLLIVSAVLAVLSIVTLHPIALGLSLIVVIVIWLHIRKDKKSVTLEQPREELPA